MLRAAGLPRGDFGNPTRIADTTHVVDATCYYFFGRYSYKPAGHGARRMVPADNPQHEAHMPAPITLPIGTKVKFVCYGRNRGKKKYDGVSARGKCA